MRPDFSQLSALVVDDSPHMIMLLSSVPRQLGVRRITSAANVPDACHLLRNWTPDVVFVDWMMVPTNGIELVKVIRSGKAIANPTVPIVLVTGHSEAVRVHEARDVGATAFVAKPFSPAIIAKKLEAVLRTTR